MVKKALMSSKRPYPHLISLNFTLVQQKIRKMQNKKCNVFGTKTKNDLLTSDCTTLST